MTIYIDPFSVLLGMFLSPVLGVSIAALAYGLRKPKPQKFGSVADFGERFESLARREP